MAASKYSENLRSRLAKITDYKPEFDKAFEGFVDNPLPKDEIYFQLERQMNQKKKRGGVGVSVGAAIGTGIGVGGAINVNNGHNSMLPNIRRSTSLLEEKKENKENSNRRVIESVVQRTPERK